MQKKAEERKQEIETYVEEKKEESKDERIKKGLAALNMGGMSGEQMQEKRKNFMTEIRDALIAGEAVNEEGFTKKLKKKKKNDEPL